MLPKIHLYFLLCASIQVVTLLPLSLPTQAHDTLFTFSNCSLVMFSPSWLYSSLFIFCVLAITQSLYYSEPSVDGFCKNSTHHFPLLFFLSTHSTEYWGHIFCLFVIASLFQRLFIPNYLELVSAGFMILLVFLYSRICEYRKYRKSISAVSCITVRLYAYRVLVDYRYLQSHILSCMCW